MLPQTRTWPRSSLLGFVASLSSVLLLGDIGCGFVGIGFQDDDAIATGGALSSGGADHTGGHGPLQTGGRDAAGGVSPGSGGIVQSGGEGGEGSLGGQGGALGGLVQQTCFGNETDCVCPERGDCSFTCEAPSGACRARCEYQSTCNILPGTSHLVVLACQGAQCTIEEGSAQKLIINCDKLGGTCKSECGENQTCTLTCYDSNATCECETDTCQACYGDECPD